MPRPLAALALLLAAPLAASAEPYPKGDLLLEPVSLARPKVAAAFVVLDARPRAEYDAGHVPGARWVDPAAWEKAFDAADAKGWSARLGALGLTPASKIAVYDANRNKDAARVWWILRYWGAADVRLVQGGWAGWAAAKLPTSTDAPAVAPAAFAATPQAGRFASKGDLLESLKTGKWQIVDARSAAEHCGDEKLKNKRAGAVPGAKPLEWSDLVEAGTQRFKPPAELRKLFADAGVRLDAPSATYCQGGGRAAVMAFGMELMGAAPVRNYYRSWGEWGNSDDTPVAVPAKK